MGKKYESRVIWHIGDIVNFPLGTVIAGKHGFVFDMMDDYYDVGLITPILRQETLDGLLNSLLEASKRMYTPKLREEINRIARGSMSSDWDDYPKKVPSTTKDIFIWCSQIEAYDRGQFLKDMSADRILLSFEAPVPEDARLAKKVVLELEKELAKDELFKYSLRKWKQLE